MAVVLRGLYVFDVNYSKKLNMAHSNEINVLHEIEFAFRRCIGYTFGKYFNQSKRKIESTNQKNNSNQCICFLFQDIDFETHHIPSRFIVILWSFFTIVLPATYTASLISFLANPVFISPFNTLDDLADSNSFKPIIVSQSLPYFYLNVLNWILWSFFFCCSHYFSISNSFLWFVEQIVDASQRKADSKAK